jgi:hypothetical protein
MNAVPKGRVAEGLLVSKALTVHALITTTLAMPSIDIVPIQARLPFPEILL